MNGNSSQKIECDDMIENAKRPMEILAELLLSIVVAAVCGMILAASLSDRNMMVVSLLTTLLSVPALAIVVRLGKSLFGGIRFRLF